MQCLRIFEYLVKAMDVFLQKSVFVYKMLHTIVR